MSGGQRRSNGVSTVGQAFISHYNVIINNNHYSLILRERGYNHDLFYRIAGKFGGDLNLAVWRSGLKSPN